MHFQSVGAGAVLFSALALGTLGAPRPQNYDFADLLSDEPAVDEIVIPASATAATLSVNPTSASEAVAAAATEIAQDLKDQVIADGGISRRGTRNPACADEAKSTGPVVSPDTYDAFMAAGFAGSSLAGATAGTAVPSGYTNIYIGAQGQLPAYGWYALKTLPAYDVQQCANYCSSFTACSSFNIFYERLPQQNPSCNPDTPSVTSVKCVAHGWSPVSADQATNKGQYRGSFRTATAGAAAYVQTYSSAPSIAGFSDPKTLASGKCAINAPLDPENKGVDGKNLDTYMGTKLFTNTPFDPSLCTKLCQDTTTADSKNIPAAANGLYKTCNYVNVFMLNKNSQAQGMQCSMYSRDWKDQEDALAVNCGYTDARWNDKYTITRSTSYALQPSSRTDVAKPAAPVGTNVKFTFEPATLTAPDSVEIDNKGGSIWSPLYGFLGYANTKLDVAWDRALALVSYSSSDLARRPDASGKFGVCNPPRGCTLKAQGFTFDLHGLNFADVGRARGTYTIRGMRQGVEVVRYDAPLPSGTFWPDNFVGNLGDAWKNLDAIQLNSPQYTIFKNLDVTKYPTTKGQKRGLTILAEDHSFGRRADNNDTAEILADPAGHGLTALEYLDLLQATNGTTGYVI